VALIMVAHGIAALRTVYGGSWTGSAVRAMFVSLVYGILLFAVSAAVAVTLILR
jgi:hypothetical protein